MLDARLGPQDVTGQSAAKNATEQRYAKQIGDERAINPIAFA
ncbi:hypothetical protein [Sphingobium sp. MK2]